MEALHFLEGCPRVELVRAQLIAKLDEFGSAACLNFHQTERAVRTASSEQVRQPIYQSGVDQWANYSTWLDPLRETLGPELVAI